MTKLTLTVTAAIVLRTTYSSNLVCADYVQYRYVLEIYVTCQQSKKHLLLLQLFYATAAAVELGNPPM